MNDKLTYCENCNQDTEYEIVNLKMSGRLKDVTYFYDGKEARCKECGKPVYVPEVNDYNLKQLYDVFRVKNDIVPLEVVKEIPEKYDIGKRPLSLLLGWGELTFSRYYDGDMPTKQYSKILKEIYESPLYYKKVLEEGKNNLPSESTYNKSMKAVMNCINEMNKNDSKINIVIQYLLNKCEDVTPLALQKALYYTQGFYYAFNKKYIFSENCEAWVHGPVYHDIYARYKDYQYDAIEQYDHEIDESKLSTSEKAVIDSIIKYFCCYSGKVLESFTHNETPWIETRGDMPASASSAKVISKRLIGEYFSSVKEKYQMINPSDISAYSDEMFRMI
jgi:Uncharacterized phage-associated protein